MSREKGGFWVGLTAVFFYPLSWIGKMIQHGNERIPREGGVLLVMNHVSHFDPVVDGVFVHKNKRVPRILSKESVLRMPIFGRMARGVGTIPVYRGTSDARASLSAAIDALAEGKLVVIYPEGTITKDPDGWPMYPRTGVARLALEVDVPVIPVARYGTQAILNGYTKKFRPFPRKPVHFNVGEPIDLSAYRGKPVTPELLREVTHLIMDRIRDLVAEIRDEKPPTEFFRPPTPADPSADEERAS
ncbi:MAG TPA: lysophospholipid acyltransferase family protein [Actinophytocola sp.]|uniref:lysophospholipid acyltransferase family protein n=1 Tax=Actinophytocola sp. TaxID=1872138 RepID=UPI002DDDAE0C|nr:lysophospholipid acyltransferase family protein [Actinophytocola sp.]HEV2781038.1 lysophospholipid acyltransferase family protein [Actinophytocola sp.]